MSLFRPIFLFLCTTCLLSSPLFARPIQPPKAPPIITLDAGHTLTKPGALAANDGRSELEFNHDLVNALEKKLSAVGNTVNLSNWPVRESENFTARAAVGQGSSLFLSIHHDSAKAALLTPILNPNTQEILRYEDQAGRFFGFGFFIDPNDTLALKCSRFMAKALKDSGEHPSLYHASSSLGESRTLIDKSLGIHSFPRLAIVRQRKAPTILFEAGVIVNPVESQRLRESATVEKIAQALAIGLNQCLNH